MRGIGADYIAFFLFILLFVAAVVGEILWLSRKGWTTTARAIGYVLSTDLVGFGVGSAIVFTSVFVMFMMVMGPAGTGGSSSDSAYVAVTATTLIIPAMILFLLKRLGLLLFKIREGKPAWIYSLAVAITILVFTMIPPPLFFWLATRFG